MGDYLAGTARALSVILGCGLISGCLPASKIAAPLRPPGFAVTDPSLAQRFSDYDAAMSFMATHNNNVDHKALSCGRDGSNEMWCAWSPHHENVAEAIAVAQDLCEKDTGRQCSLFAVDGHLSDWAAAIADQYDPAGAAGRDAAFAADQRNGSGGGGGGGGGGGPSLDDAINLVGALQGLVGAAQGAVGGVPAPASVRTPQLPGTDMRSIGITNNGGATSCPVGQHLFMPYGRPAICQPNVN